MRRYNSLSSCRDTAKDTVDIPKCLPTRSPTRSLNQTFPRRNISMGVICISWRLWGKYFSSKREHFTVRISDLCPKEPLNLRSEQTAKFRACLHRGGGPQLGEVTRLARGRKIKRVYMHSYNLGVLGWGFLRLLLRLQLRSLSRGVPSSIVEKDERLILGHVY